MLKRFQFTINNYSLDDIDQVCACPYNYVCVGFEVGKEGTPHMQGYMELITKRRIKSVKKMLPRAHFEKAKGTMAQNKTYCKKDGNFIEDGIPAQQGKRSDLVGIRAVALEGGMREVMVQPQLNLQQIKVAEYALRYLDEPRDEKPTVYWYYGPTGTGKSRRAREKITDAFVKNSASKWWDGYDGHETVIIDDFRDSWWDLTYMLGLLDRYAFTVETKGGTRQFKGLFIIVTSALSPYDCYPHAREKLDQLTRRIDVIQKLGEQEVERVILKPLDDNGLGFL